MKRKDLLQKSSTVAAVVLAAALMDPSAVQASAGEAGTAANAAQIQEQSAENENTDGDAAVEQNEDEKTTEAGGKEENAPESEAEQTDETDGIAENTASVEEVIEKTEQSDENVFENTESTGKEDETVSSDETRDGTIAISESEAVQDETDTDINTTENTASTGWIENEDGSTQYIKEDGAFANSEILTIDGQKYYFDWNGYLVKGQRFEVWDNEADTADYYEASETGELLVSQWDEKHTSYYGENGAAYRGLHTIDGKKYYFEENGYVKKGERFAVSNDESDYNDIYEASDDGVLLENSWDANQEYYYGADGKSLHDGAFNIEGDYYAFDAWGDKVTDGMFEVDAGKGDGTTIWVIAQPDGKLYVNQWVDQYGERSYCGENGAAYTGFQTVNGKQYFFSEENAVLYRGIVIKAKDGNCYVTAENGEAVKAENNAWTEWDGKRYYVKNGTFLRECTERIGDDYYGFNYNGAMHEDCGFWVDQYDEEKNYIGQHFYRAKEGGTLYTNTWYEEREYYQADGERCEEGAYTIDGKEYYFRYGSILRNEAVEKEDGTCCIVGQDGIVNHANANGWTEIDGKYYYASNGKFLRDGIKKVGDSYYYFYTDGSREQDSFLYFWDEETKGYVACRAQKDGTLATGWYQWYGTKYYYGTNGIGYEGFQTVDGKQYYFNQGRCYCDTAEKIDGINYIFESDGTPVEAKDNSWNQAGENIYYVKDGEFLKECVEKIGDAYYGFNGEGVRYQDISFKAWDETSKKRVSYRAGFDGKLLIGWYTEGSEKYYYGADAKGYEGLQTVDGKQYYFKNAKMLRNETLTIDGKYYIVNDSGKLIEAKNNAWTEADGYFYYLKSGKFLNNCVEKINGSLYR